MVYGELGRSPIEVTIKQRIIGYWCKLIDGPQQKYACIMYKLCHDLHSQQQCKLPWLDKVKSDLDNLGFSNTWETQSYPNSEWFMNAVKLRLSDQAKQDWTRMLNESSKCITYRIFKHELSFEPYLDELPTHLAIVMTKFRCSNHRLPI